MELYNATLELAGKTRTNASKKADRLLQQFSDFHPTLTTSDLCRLELIISLPAESLWQATTSVRSLTASLNLTRVIIETSADFDARSDASTDPELLSVTEVAEHLGITRGGVQRRIETGTLQAFRVGTTWAIPAAAVRLPNTTSGQ